MKAQLSREELKQLLIECSQNASGMFEVGEDTMCAMMALLDGMSSEPVAYLSPDIEYMAEQAECVSMKLDECNVPKSKGGHDLSLWGRVVAFRVDKTPAPVAVPDDVVTIAERLVREYIANKGTSSEFICCITPQRSSIGTGGVWDDWKALDAALSACRAAMQAEPVSPRYTLSEEKGSSLQLRNLIRQRHAEWSDKTFGNVGPVGPLKHLAKEAIEASEALDDLSEWADMQFLLWDAQRRAGISDGEITAALEEKLKVNMARQWPEPKDGEPRLHVKPEQEV